MPLPRFHKLPADKQVFIIDAARAEFARHGFAEASLNRIIEAAGISKGAFYYYFADKSDLYCTVMHAMLDSVAAALVGLPSPQDASAFWQWGGLAMGMLGGVLSDPTLGALARDLYAAPPAAAYAELHARVSDWTQQGIALGQQLGAVRQDLPRDLLVAATTGLLVAIDSWFAEALAETSMEELTVLAEKSLLLIRNMLEPPEQGPARSAS